MCSTTPKTKAASPGVVTPASIGDKTKAITPFQTYLDKVYEEVKNVDSDLGPDFGPKTHVPISIFLRSKGPIHTYAGVFDEEHHFSASLMKVAAMFAAFKLRREALLLAEKVKDGTVVLSAPANQTKFFNKLDAQFNPNDAVPGIATQSGINKRPKYAEILSVTGFPNLASLTVQFIPNFQNHMLKMIVPSNNCSAGECIVTLGYPYINVKLMEDGFFDKSTWNTPTPKGIWLAGDYIVTAPPALKCFNADKKHPYVRITTVNDCDATHFCGSAQNTGSKEMARFYLKIMLEELVDQQSSKDMRDLLHKAQFGTPPFVPPPDTSFVSRVTAIPLLFDVDAVKIGQAEIKPDSQRGNIEVRSEGIIINWKIPNAAARKKWDDLNLTGEAAICWQNLPNNVTLNGIAKIINQSVSQFVNQDPVP